MPADLARTPTSGFDAQIGGDAHLSNFGAHASPERPKMGLLELWYDDVSADDVAEASGLSAARVQRFQEHAKRKNSDQADPSVVEAGVTAAFEASKGTVDDHLRFPLDRYELVDIGVKVVSNASSRASA